MYLRCLEAATACAVKQQEESSVQLFAVSLWNNFFLLLLFGKQHVTKKRTTPLFIKVLFFVRSFFFRWINLVSRSLLCSGGASENRYKNIYKRVFSVWFWRSTYTLCVLALSSSLSEPHGCPRPSSARAAPWCFIFVLLADSHYRKRACVRRPYTYSPIQEYKTFCHACGAVSVQSATRHNMDHYCYIYTWANTSIWMKRLAEGITITSHRTTYIYGNVYIAEMCGRNGISLAFCITF